MQQEHLSGLLGLGLKYAKRQRVSEQFFATLNAWITRHLISIQREDSAYFIFLLEYLVMAWDFDKEPVLDRIISAAERISEEVTEQVMTIADQLRQEGRQEGMQQGMQQGMRQGELNLVMHLLNKKFGALSPAQRARLSALSAGELLALSERVLEVQQFNELFN